MYDSSELETGILIFPYKHAENSNAVGHFQGILYKSNG